MFLHKKKNSGFTLIEIMVAALVFSIGFFGLLFAQYQTKFIAEGALIRYVTLQYSRGLLETIQSYDYEDTLYPHTSDPITDALAVFNSHDVVFGGFTPASSGVCDNLGNIVTSIADEERIGLQYYPTSINLSATALNPYTIASTLQQNVTLIGPEEDDVGAFTSIPLGEYKITEDQQKLNIFSFNGEGQERAFFFDDADDFDGYVETRELIPGVEVRFEVSVTGVYANMDDYDFEIQNADSSLTGTSLTITQQRLSLMPSISFAGISTQFASELSASDNPSLEAQRLGYAFYNMMLFKKITIKATFEYPIDSGNINTLVIDGGKVNPRGSILL